MSLFLGRYDLNNGRNVRNRMGLGIGDMPLLNDEAGAVFAYLGSARRHVHGMTAAGEGHSQTAKDGANNADPGPIEPFFPAGSHGCFKVQIHPDVIGSMLCDNREGLFCDIPPSGFIIVGKPFPIRALLLVFQEGIIHILGDSLGMIALIIFSHFIMLLLVSSEKLEKLHGGGFRDHKSRVVAGSEYPAPALRIDGLHGQIHGKNVFATIIHNIIRHSNT